MSLALTSPRLILPRQHCGYLVTVKIRLGLYFIIGQTIPLSGESTILLAVILAIKSTQQVHPFLRYHGELTWFAFVDIHFNCKG